MVASENTPKIAVVDEEGEVNSKSLANESTRRRLSFGEDEEEIVDDTSPSSSAANTSQPKDIHFEHQVIDFFM